jgi:pyruvate/2-oxoacid:ferredoxin oxidoreductase alpha subunit
MADLTALAFDLADKYRNPVFVLADGAIGQMMEPVEFMATPVEPRHMPSAVEATRETRRNLVTSIYLEPDNLEAHVRKLEAKYRRCEREEVRFEEYQTGDAEIVLMGYGITARILKAVVEQLRTAGLPVGLLRPITLYPFPVEAVQRLAQSARLFAVVELSNGQMVDDVRLALNGLRPVEFYGRVGGNVPSAEEVARFVRKIAGQHGVAAPEEVMAHV